MTNKWSLLLIFSCFFAIQSQAQTLKNALKLGLGGLPGLELQLEYERGLKGNSSFQIELIGGIPRTIPQPFTSPFLAMGTTVGTGDMYYIREWTKNQKFAVGLIPEFRFYPLRENGMRGFYVAPYAKGRINFYQADGLYKSHHATGVTAKMRGNVYTVGAGLGIGYQLVMGARRAKKVGGAFMLDVGLGLGVDYHIMRVNYTSDYEAENYDYWASLLGDAIQDVPVYGKKFDTTVAGSKVQSKGNMLFVGVRPSLSLGYIFH